MRTFTGSTSCDDRATRGNNKGKIMVNLKENIRDPEEIERLNNMCLQYGKPPHYDLEKAQRNIVYEQCLTKEEAFLAVFEYSMNRYNDSQKRSDRKTSVEKELAKLERGKIKQELIHTMIIQVGNKDSRPSEAECIEILQEYLARFREKYPNMRIVSAAIHLDEDTPHLQIYYIPVKTKEQHEAMGSGKKWSGMDVQPSLTGALEQMGYTNDATILVPKKDEQGNPVLDENGEPVMVETHDYKQGAMAQWQRDFNGLLDEICLNHGIELDHYQRNQKVSHQDTLDYQEGRIQRDVTNAKNELNNAEADLSKALLEVENAQEANEKLTEANRTLRSQNKALKDANEDLKGKVDAATEKAATMEQKADAAEERLAKAENAFSRFMERVSAWVNEHTGLQRILRTAWRLSDVHRDKIEVRRDAAVKRGEAALAEAADDIESLLKAADEMERGKQTFKALKTAAKEDLDPDELLEDDFEM